MNTQHLTFYAIDKKTILVFKTQNRVVDILLIQITCTYRFSLVFNVYKSE